MGSYIVLCCLCVYVCVGGGEISLDANNYVAYTALLALFSVFVRHKLLSSVIIIRIGANNILLPKNCKT